MSGLPAPVLSHAEAWLKPISENAPAGEDAKYDDRHVSVRTEVGKMEAPAGGAVDWEKVAKEGTELLQNTSKDLLIASYTSYALYQTRGLPGLVSGLSMLAGLIDQFWDSMYPPAKRMRGRANAVTWLIDRAAPSLEGRQPEASERAVVEQLEEVSRALSQISREKYGDAAPAMRPLLDSIARMEMSLPEAPEETTQPNPAAGAPAVAPTDAPPPQTVTQPTPPAAPSPAAPPKPEAEAKPEAPDVGRWMNPISEAAPSGENAKYDDLHVSVRSEVGKLEAPAGGAVDWEKVVKEGTFLLQNTSKDLLIVVYVAMGLYENTGVPGLQLGLALINGVSEKFWETMFPPIKRMRGRGNALGWFTERCAQKLEGYQPKADEKAVLEGALAQAKQLASFSREKCGEHAPATRPLVDGLQRAVMSVPAPKPAAPPKPKEEPARAAPTKPAASPQRSAPKVELGAAPTASLADAEAAVGYLRDVGTALVSAAAKLRAASPQDPTAYRIMRQGLWLHMSNPPPAQAGKTKVPPLQPAVRSKLDLMAQNEKWPALLDEAESSLGTFRFALDLHRYVAMALKGMGAEAAARTVETEMISCLRRFEGIESFQAGDGSPLADQQTVAWLQSLAPTGGGPSAGGGEAMDEAATEALSAASAQAKKGALGEAISAVEAVARAQASGRARFSLRLGAAKIAFESQRPELARALHEGLDEQVRAHDLERWEPTLVAEHLSGYLKCIQAESKPPGGLPPEAGMLYRRLVRLDPVAAARMKV